MIRPMALVVLALQAAACVPARPPIEQAPGTLALQIDVAGGGRVRDRGWATLGSGSLGVEITGCCGVGAYGGGATLGGKIDVPATTGGDKDVRKTLEEVNLDQLLVGGVELHGVAPIDGWLTNRLRFRARGGKAGTPPTSTKQGRNGYGLGGDLLFRVLDPDVPAVGEAGMNVDLVAGFSTWLLRHERTPAGPVGDSESLQAITFGVRVGADYGIQLK